MMMMVNCLSINNINDSRSDINNELLANNINDNNNNIIIS